MPQMYFIIPVPEPGLSPTPPIYYPPGTGVPPVGGYPGYPAPPGGPGVPPVGGYPGYPAPPGGPGVPPVGGYPGYPAPQPPVPGQPPGAVVTPPIYLPENPSHPIVIPPPPISGGSPSNPIVIPPPPAGGLPEFPIGGEGWKVRYVPGYGWIVVPPANWTPPPTATPAR